MSLLLQRFGGKVLGRRILTRVARMQSGLDQSRGPVAAPRRSIVVVRRAIGMAPSTKPRGRTLAAGPGARASPARSGTRTRGLRPPAAATRREYRFRASRPRRAGRG